MEDLSKTLPRLHSLDAFRGLVISSMLLVNMTWDRGVFHPQLFHVPWDDPLQGATFTDLVFPWFVFIVGGSLPLSIDSGRGKGRSAAGMVLTAARRGAVLYLLGVVLTVASRAYETPLSWMNLLEWNILQLIGAAYFVSVCVWLLPLGWRVGFVVAVLLAKWALMTALPWETVVELVGARTPEGAPEGHGTWAYFEAIKRAANFQFVETAWLRNTLGWLGMAQQYLPLSTVAVLGGFTTAALNGERTAKRAAWVALAGAAMIGLAFLLQSGYAAEGGGLLGPFTVPLSKLFFSPAYCLLAAGTGAVLLAGCFAVVDVARWTTAWPLRVFGLNAIALYVGAELSFKTVFSKWQMPLPEGGSDSLAGGFQAWVRHATGSPAAAGWCFVLAWLGGWWLVCWWLYRQRVFLKV